MYHTLLHFSRLCCRPQAVCAPLKVLSRQTTPRTHNVFDRAISHRSDLGSFYQVMNTWKRLHCFFFSPQQCHCLFFLAAHQTTAILSTSQRENKKDKSSIVDFDKLIIPSRFLQGGKKKIWMLMKLLSVISERTSETDRSPLWNHRSWQSTPALCSFLRVTN